LGVVVFGLVAKGAGTEGYDGAGRPHVALDGGGDESFHEGPLLGDLLLAPPLADEDDLIELLEELGLEIAGVLGTSLGVAALTWLESGVCRGRL